MSVDLLSEPIMDTGTQHFCVEVMKRLDIERKNGQFCDLILEVGSGDEKARLEAHRNILSAASPFFYKALNSNMKEKIEGVIRLEETSKAIMEGVLDYIYTGYVSVSEDNVYELFAKADYFDLPALKSFLSNFILENLSLSNCVIAYYFASKYQWEQLMRGTRAYILSNFLSVAETDDFLDLSFEQVKEWISSDEIIVDAEDNVFEVVLRWSERGERRKRDNFRDLFRHIRFVHMSRDYLFQVILSHPLVRDNVECSSVVLNAMKLAFDGTDNSLFSQAPRNCLKTHDDVIVACGERKVFCYLPDDTVWYELPVMDHGRNSLHQSVSACHGKLYVMGGNQDGVVEHFDPSLGRWNEVNIPDKVAYSSAAVTMHGFLYVVGGKDGIGNQCTVQKYNPDTNQWLKVCPLSTPRSGVCVVTDGSYLYAIGGIDKTGQYLNIVERFDPRKNTWENLPPMLARRANAGGAVIKQRLFVFGGDSRDNYSCEVFDHPTNMWSSIPSRDIQRKPTSAVSFKGKIYVYTNSAGSNGSKNFQVYDVDQNQWEPRMFPVDTYELYRLSCLRVSKNALSTYRKVLK
ncbi:kelch-like protein 25 [Porites lutea]|uniref:kelch-like protein 25 n=1 Tax=Porites lutea TaxID=51062 RepID=UPI003CC5CAED